MRTKLNVQSIGSQLRHRVLVASSGILPLLDFTALILAAYIGEWIASPSAGASLLSADGSNAGVRVVIGALLGSILLYDKRFAAGARRGQISALLRWYLMGFLLFAAGALVIGYASGVLGTNSPRVFTLWLGLSFVLTAATRTVLAKSIHRLARDGWLSEVVAIVGAGSLANRLAWQAQTNGLAGMKILGVFDDDLTADRGERGPIAGTVEDLLELGKTRHIDWIFLNPACTDERRLAALVRRLKALAVPVALCPWNVGLGTPYQSIDYVGGALPVTLLVDHAAKRWPRKVRAACRFLPRWMSTWLLLLPVSLVSLWSRTHAGPRDAARKESKMVCPLNNYELSEFVGVASNFGQSSYGYVVTPNVDHLIRLHEDTRFRELYRAARYVLLDSQFLARLLRVTSKLRLPVCTGSDLTAKLLSEVARPEDRIIIIGGESQQVAELTDRYQLHNLVQFIPPMGFIRDPLAVEACAQFIEAHSPFRFCFIAVGAPQQEILAELLQQRGIARGLSLCVGASIDFITGKQRRAPQWMRRVGLEWLYRLMRNPTRMASRYLVRGPRVFGLLRHTTFVLRAPAAAATATATALAA